MLSRGASAQWEAKFGMGSLGGGVSHGGMVFNGQHSGDDNHETQAACCGKYDLRQGTAAGMKPYRAQLLA